MPRTECNELYYYEPNDALNNYELGFAVLHGIPIAFIIHSLDPNLRARELLSG